jgi:hypothetical protein
MYLGFLMELRLHTLWFSEYSNERQLPFSSHNALHPSIVETFVVDPPASASPEPGTTAAAVAALVTPWVGAAVGPWVGVGPGVGPWVGAPVAAAVVTEPGPWSGVRALVGPRVMSPRVGVAVVVVNAIEGITPDFLLALWTAIAAPFSQHLLTSEPYVQALQLALAVHERQHASASVDAT